MSEENNKKDITFLQTLRGAFYNRYIALSLFAVVLAAGAWGIGANPRDIISTAASALLLTSVSAYDSFKLRKYGITRMTIKERIKQLDPRLIGSSDDNSAVGCVLGLLAGICAALSELFMVGGGIFSHDTFAAPMLMAVAKGASIAASIGFVTSEANFHSILFFAAAQYMKKPGIFKAAGKVTYCSQLMEMLGAVSAGRICAVSGISSVIMICSLAGAGSCFSPMASAFLAAAAVTATRIIPGKPVEQWTSSEEKIPLWNRRLKIFCVVNALVFTAVSVFFMFSFPIRSVYTYYESKNTFDYYSYDENAEVIEIMSVPQFNAENAALYNGMFVVTGLYVIISAAAASRRRYTGELLSGIKTVPVRLVAAAALMLIYPLLRSIVIPSFRLDAVMWVVALGIACIFILIELMYGFARQKSENTDNA